jgi:hypothetical protein
LAAELVEDTLDGVVYPAVLVEVQMVAALLVLVQALLVKVLMEEQAFQEAGLAEAEAELVALAEMQLLITVAMVA